MTLHQIEALTIILGMLGLFASDRVRYDLVAALALTAALLTGVVPVQKAFMGFASPVIIIIASVLVISRAIAISGVIDTVMRRILLPLKSTTLQVGALTAAVTFISAFVKNVGALGVFMPIAIQVAKRSKRPASRYLMPLAFGSLIGGTITQIGTSPNILISQVRQEVLGHPYHLFDFTAVGLPLSIISIIFLSVGWRLIPSNRPSKSSHSFAVADYTSEALLPDKSPMVGKTVIDLERLCDNLVRVASIIRGKSRYYDPGWRKKLLANDILVLQGDSTALEPLIRLAGLKMLGGEDRLPPPNDKDDVLEIAEAVVAPNSELIGRTARDLDMRQQYEVNLLALSRIGIPSKVRLRHNTFEAGDIVVLQGRQTPLNRALSDFHLLPLAERNLTTIGRLPWRYLSLIILALALLAIGIGWVAVEAGFFIAATAIMLFRLITPREAYDAIEWPIIIMLGCLIPVGEALKDTGVTELLAAGLTIVASHLTPSLSVGLIMVVSMLLTPLLHHAAAVLVMGPVAAVVAVNLGVAPDAFLMAVAFGAACDFLTPIGHQNSALVMRPGGYRFSDYWRLGLTLSILVAGAGTWLILQTWPL